MSVIARLSVLAMIAAASAHPLAAQEPVLDQLKAQFNEDQGVLRLIVLVSPTCPACVGGASWIDDYVLTRYPNLPIEVYAVWYEMYPGDSSDDFPVAQKLMPDRRVTHWWDPSKDVGRWFTHVVPTNLKGEIQWDAFYLYGKDAVWDEGDPAPLLAWGRTILNDRKKLADKIEELAGPPTAPVIELLAPASEQ
jgi:hypothetical protein